MEEIRVGIAGFSASCFNYEKAKLLVSKVFDNLQEKYLNKKIIIVSGYTNCGIPAIAYAEATRRGLFTIGIACEKVYENDLFPVDDFTIVGKEWGDESQTFIDSIDVFIRIGGGPQSRSEEQMARDADIPVNTYGIPE
jgi:hypothetical protein